MEVNLEINVGLRTESINFLLYFFRRTKDQTISIHKLTSNISFSSKYSSKIYKK